MTSGSSVFARSLFDLQVAFAEKAATLAGVPFERALLDYTNLYVRFGLGRDFDAEHPSWRSYLAGLRNAEDRQEWTYRFYLEDAESRTAPAVVATFGCFSYAIRDDGRVRLHFRNVEPEDVSPLAASRADARRVELRALFAHVRCRAGDEVPVLGASWLYNLDAYRRLFPPAYVSTARVLGGAYRSMALWGQLVDRHGEPREPLVRRFRAALARTERVADLDACFPFPVLTVTAPVRCFG